MDPWSKWARPFYGMAKLFSIKSYSTFSAKMFQVHYSEMYTIQSWSFKMRDRARAFPHAPCFVEVRDKHAPSKIFTLLRAPGNKTVCKKGRTILLLISQ